MVGGSDLRDAILVILPFLCSKQKICTQVNSLQCHGMSVYGGCIWRISWVLFYFCPHLRPTQKKWPYQHPCRGYDIWYSVYLIYRMHFLWFCQISWSKQIIWFSQIPQSLLYHCASTIGLLVDNNYCARCQLRFHIYIYAKHVTLNISVILLTLLLHKT